MESKARAALTFAVCRGSALVRRETVTQDIIKIGKDARSHLRVDDEGAARMHAVIEVASASDLTLIDLGNETKVNGQSINKCKLRVGDEIAIGSTRLVLESVESLASIAPPPAANPFAGANPFAIAPPVAHNPFVAQAKDALAHAPTVPASIAVEPGGYAYSMLKNGPDVPVDEVEVPHLSAIEVLVMWGSNVLHVSHLTPPRSYAVGEEGEGCDYFVPAQALGTTRAPVVVSRGLGASLVLLPNAKGWIEMPGQGRVEIADLVASGRARPSGELAGAFEIDLAGGAKARLELEGGIAFQVSAVNAGKPVPVGFLQTLEKTSVAFTGLSFLLHMGLVAVFAFFMPRMTVDDSEGIDRDQLLTMQRLLNASAMQEQDRREEQKADANQGSEGGEGERHKGEEGKLGDVQSKETNHRYAVQGPHDNPDPHLARKAELADASKFGMIGLIAAMAHSPDAPTSPWAQDDALGKHDRNANGNMFGDDIGNAAGTGGLGLSGPGEGGGGRGEGIGMNNFGGLGWGGGCVPGATCGVGIGPGGGGITSSRGILPPGHTPKGPSIRPAGPVSVNGHLPPEVIQRIVRQNFGRFRMCYENGLRSNPNLSGRVAVKFVINREGAVALTADGGSDLPDSGVVRCVVSSFGALSFPAPDGGQVTVIYPITFNPGDQ